jgi:hypothetical protein
VPSYYIYYKVPAAESQNIRAAAEELQRGLASKTGVRGRLMCRRDEPQTWMEIYEDVPDIDAFERALDAELKRVKFAELLGGARHTEIFAAF